MLKLDLVRIFAVRGVKDPFKTLRKLGISHGTAWNLLSGRVKSISYRHMELICERLNCTPNDLYSWKPNRDAVDVERHPLKGLMRDDNAADIGSILNEVPLDKLNEARDMLASLKNGE